MQIIRILSVSFILPFMITIIFGCGAKPEGDRKGIESILWWYPISGIPIDGLNVMEDYIGSGFSLDLDNNGMSEVVLSAGQELKIFNGQNGNLISKNSEFMNKVAAGDINGDGTYEILTCTKREVAGYPVFLLTAFDYMGNELWMTLFQDMDTCSDFGLFDIDNDNALDIFVILPFYSRLLRINGTDGKVIFEKDFPDTYFSFMSIGDVDKNGTGEIILVDNLNKAIMAINGTDGSLLWSTTIGKEKDKIVWAIIGDVDADGQPEIVANVRTFIMNIINPEKNMGADVITVLNGDNGSVRFRITPETTVDNPYSNEESITLSVFYPAISDLNNDGFLDITGMTRFIKIGYDTNGQIAEYYGEKVYFFALSFSQNLLWQKLLYEYKTEIKDKYSASLIISIGSVQIWDVLSADFNDDRVPDIIAIESGHIQVRDGKTGEGLFWYDFYSDRNPEWKAVSFVKIFSISDVNSDGFLEILALVYDNTEKWDVHTRLVILSTDTPATALLPWPMSYHDPYRTGNYNFVE